MKVKLVNGKPSEFYMNSDEVTNILVEHINKLLKQKFNLFTKVKVDSTYFGIENHFEGDITTNPEVPVLSEIEL